MFEIRLQSDTKVACTSLTEAIYRTYRNRQYVNTYIKAPQGAISFLNEALNSENFMDTRMLWSLSGVGKFIDMMRHILADHYQSCRRSSSVDPSQERTFFCETVVPIFKNFGLMIGDFGGSFLVDNTK